MTVEIATENPRQSDVTALLERHLTFCHAMTPLEHAFALDLDGLLDPDITLVAARRDGELLAIGALKELDPSHGEVKSMHTVAEARGLGIGRALLDHLLATAAARGYDRVSLETGTMDAFAPARTLYAKAGFVPCGPFADYTASPDNTFLTLALTGTMRTNAPSPTP